MRIVLQAVHRRHARDRGRQAFAAQIFVAQIFVAQIFVAQTFRSARGRQA